MDNHHFEQFDIQLDPNEPLFIIGVVSRIVDIPIWTLRKLDEMGVVSPQRLGRSVRCYSKEQIKVLNYVHYLMVEKGVNISGIKVILTMEER
ncbi:MAG TPA: MerR family transcriptional regulator [Candidatus Omnitrophota bacterium]|jgi:MerR family transcriptional regulator/heat shock protein HspR|nr:MerR family transcriptional regulator [Candidatus Omnitrophota bacterium]HSA31702.1 MerR family transcriptional regulator [Candidatus Omnitrophota bacterium]